MSASSIVIYLDIFKDSLSHELPGGKALAVNSFNFQRVKEALSASVDAPMSCQAGIGTAGAASLLMVGNK